jgi:hypothetical protein
MEHLTIFLLYSLRFSVIFAVVLLWVVAMSQIGSHRSKGLFMTAELAFMAVAVSAVAVCVIAALNAVVPFHAWNENSPRGGVVAATPAEKKCDAYSYTFTYSFGLRRPSSVPEDCMVGQANNLRPSQPLGNSGGDQTTRGRTKAFRKLSPRMVGQPIPPGEPRLEISRRSRSGHNALETVDGRFARVYIPLYGKHVLACGVREGGRDGRGRFDCEI